MFWRHPINVQYSRFPVPTVWDQLDVVSLLIVIVKNTMLLSQKKRRITKEWRCHTCRGYETIARATLFFSCQTLKLVAHGKGSEGIPNQVRTLSVSSEALHGERKKKTCTPWVSGNSYIPWVQLVHTLVLSFARDEDKTDFSHFKIFFCPVFMKNVRHCFAHVT